MFDHLARLEGDDASWLDLPEVRPQARVKLRPTSEKNRPYFNALLRRANKNRALRVEQVDLDLLERNRQEDRELFGRHVLVGWEGIEDQDGNPVPFSKEAALEFCLKVPAWIFDRMRVHAGTPERFLPAGQDLPPDAEELAGNSVSGSAGS